MKQKTLVTMAAAFLLLASATYAQPGAVKQRPGVDGTILRVDGLDGEALILPYDGGIHPIESAIPGEPLSIVSAEGNVAPVTVFTFDSDDGFFFEDGLTVHPGFSGVIDFDYATSYFVFMPLIPGATGTIFAAAGAGAGAAAAAAGTLKKDVSTDLYSGNGKNIKKTVTVDAGSNCPVKAKSNRGSEITVQPGFHGDIEEVNADCKKVKIKAACTGKEGADCKFSTS